MVKRENNRIKILVRGETENNNVDINEIMEELVKRKETYLHEKSMTAKNVIRFSELQNPPLS